MPARTAGRGGREYDAFLSYSRRLDGQIATSLERELQRFAKPWYRARALRVFRDASSLSANPALWPSIEQALAHTKYFVLLASPASATSPWVGHEVQWWLANRPLDRLLIALTAGQLPWDATGPVPPQERAIAGYVAARYGREAPRWVDLRALHHESQVSRHNPVVQDAVADIGATIRGVPKDLLVGEHIREHRRTLRIAATGLVLLVILAVLSTVASVVVFRQRNAARLQARLATARQLAATAEASVGSDLSQAMLLAAAAYRMSPSPQTLQAVYAAATASPKLTRFLYAPATITALAATPDGRTILSADTSGAITRFDRVTGASTRIGTVPHVDALAASTDAATVAVTDGRRVELLGKSPRNLPLSGGRSVRSLAVSPDGRTVVVGGQIDANQKGFIDIVDTTSLHAHDLTGSAGVALVAATDTRVSVVTFGGWATIDLSGTGARRRQPHRHRGRARLRGGDRA